MTIGGGDRSDRTSGGPNVREEGTVSGIGERSGGPLTQQPVVVWGKPPDVAPPIRPWLVAGVFLTIIALTVVVTLRSGVFASHPGPRQLPPPIREAVVLVPLGGFPMDHATEIRDREASDYGIRVTVAPAIPIDPSAVDIGRRQVVAERLVAAIAAAHPESGGRTLLIGLTSEDVFIAGIPAWRFAFGLRDGGGVAVVSSARMDLSSEAGGDWSPLTKMVTRDIGFLYYGLKPTDDRTDILYGNILSLDDLNRIGDHL